VTGIEAGIDTGSESMMSATVTPSMRSENTVWATAPRAAWRRNQPSTASHRPLNAALLSSARYRPKPMRT
jgi:hypothetical protein